MVRIMKNEMQHLHHCRHHHHLHHHHNKNIPETRSGIFRKIILRDYMRFCYFITDARTVHKKKMDTTNIVKLFWKRVLYILRTSVIFFNLFVILYENLFLRTHARTLFLSFRSFRLLKYFVRTVSHLTRSV